MENKPWHLKKIEELKPGETGYTIRGAMHVNDDWTCSLSSKFGCPSADKTNRMDLLVARTPEGEYCVRILKDIQYKRSSHFIDGPQIPVTEFLGELPF